MEELTKDKRNTQNTNEEEYFMDNILFNEDVVIVLVKLRKYETILKEI